MPPDPEYTLPYQSEVGGHTYVYGVEYENIVHSADDRDVPCAVCLATTREVALMIPAKTSCPPSWTKEYEGYIMSSFHNLNKSTFICVDKSQESAPGRSVSENLARVVHAEVGCGGLECGPTTYSASKELTCVVCTYTGTD